MGQSLRVRVRLRSLLLLVGLLTIPLGWAGRELRQYRLEQAALAELQRKGAVARYTWTYADPTYQGVSKTRISRVRYALRRRLSFARVLELDVYPGPINNEQLQQIRSRAVQPEDRILALTQEHYSVWRTRISVTPAAVETASAQPELHPDR